MFRLPRYRNISFLCKDLADFSKSQNPAPKVLFSHLSSALEPQKVHDYLLKGMTIKPNLLRILSSEFRLQQMRILGHNF